MSDLTKEHLDEHVIAEYLAKHPDFFDRHGDTLRDLRLQHPSGRAVSLIEKQVSALRERNTELRHRLNQLLDNARQNDRLFERSKRLVLALLECDELGDLVDALYYSFSKEFDIPFARLILFRQPQQPTTIRVAAEDEAKVVLGRHLQAGRAVGGGLSREEITYLFDKDHQKVGSAAMVPLYYNQSLGILAVGHEDPKHYQAGMGTIFLTHIAEVLDRLIPKHLG
jgi:uncharacterized protein YigA (DUF484 family)